MSKINMTMSGGNSALDMNMNPKQSETGGTSNYEALTNKPKINDVELVGNLTSDDLGIESGITDVKINDTSIVEDGVANIPVASSNYGVARIWNAYGVSTVNGYLSMEKATNTNIDSRDANYKAIVPTNLDYALKQAMTDGKGAEWTAPEQKMAQRRIGVEQWRLIAKVEITEATRGITFDKDVDGNDFNLRKVMIYMRAIRSEDSTTNATGRIFLNNMSPTMIYSGMNVNDVVYYSNIYFELLNNGLPLGYGTTSYTSLGQNPALKTVNISPGWTPQESVYKIRIDTDKQTCNYGIGTTFEIWGVDV